MGEDDTSAVEAKVDALVAGAAPGRVRLVLAHEPHPVRRLVARLTTQARPTPTVVGIGYQPDRHARLDLADVLVDHLANAASQVFPDWYAGIEARFDLSRFPQSEREIRLQEASRRFPDISGAWLRAAWGRARRGKPLRLKRLNRAVEARQLALAIDPERLRLFLSVDPMDGPVPEPLVVARSAEWLCLQTRVPVLLFVPRAWERERGLDSVMDDRVDLGEDGAGGAFRPITAGRRDPSGVVLVDPPVGRPHGGSSVELALYEALQRAPDLAPLFQFNQQLKLSPACTPRVDVLWEEGRLAVEVDGPEHRGVAHYRADRDRDYRLVVEGYLVLRVTNEDVLEDVERVVQKIRACVEVRRQGPTT